MVTKPIPVLRAHSLFPTFPANARSQAAWRDWGIKPRRPGVAATMTGVKLLLLSLYATASYFRFAARATNPLERGRQRAAWVAGTDGGSSSADVLPWWKRAAHALQWGTMALIRFIFRYLVWVTVVIVYVAALEEVTLLNAVYMVLVVAMIGFPALRERYWIVLVIYAELVIGLFYMWGFDLHQPHGSYETLLGLRRDSHVHIWQAMRWQLAIFVLAATQLLVFRWSRSAHTVDKPGVRRHDAEFSPLLSVETDSEHSSTTGRRPSTAALWGQWLEEAAYRCWPLAVCLSLFCAGLLGDVTFIRLGFVALLATRLQLFQMRMSLSLLTLDYITLLYSTAVLVIEYMFQFDSLQRRLRRMTDQSTLNDIGLRNITSQTGLFVYLVGEV